MKLFVYPLYAMGWIAGYITKIARLVWAALVEGYQTGNSL